MESESITYVLNSSSEQEQNSECVNSILVDGNYEKIASSSY